VFTKIEEDVPRVTTPFSGLVSLVGMAFMGYLFLSEFRDAFLSQKTVCEVGIDTSREGYSRIHVDFDVLGMECDAFGFDVIDKAGDLMLDATNDKDGSTTLKKTSLTGSLGTGDGGEAEKGCKVHGHINTNKVEGEFHVGLGVDSREQQQKNAQDRDHVHYVYAKDFKLFNSSHHIHHIGFGEPFPGAVYPLDGIRKVDPKGQLHRYTYFVEVVPTVYKIADGSAIRSNQFSFTSQRLPSDITAERFWQPGVFWKYTFSAYTATCTEQQRSLARFLTRCCAILGGVFVVAGLFSSFIYYTNLRIKKLK